MQTGTPKKNEGKHTGEEKSEEELWGIKVLLRRITKSVTVTI